MYVVFFAEGGYRRKNLDHGEKTVLVNIPEPQVEKCFSDTCDAKSDDGLNMEHSSGVLGRVLGESSQKGSGKGAFFYGCYSKTRVEGLPTWQKTGCGPPARNGEKKIAPEIGPEIGPGRHAWKIGKKWGKNLGFSGF